MKRVKIAITGGIGSGKSTLLAYIKELGYPCFSCDEIYKKVLLDSAYVEKVRAHFPECIVNGQIDKSILSDIVFTNTEKRERLNALAHPMIMERLDREMQKTSGIVFAEVPLLFEGNYEGLFDKIIVLLRETSLRIQSLRERDGENERKILQKIATQFNYQSDAARRRLSTPNVYLLYNNNRKEDLQAEIRSILKNIELS